MFDSGISGAKFNLGGLMITPGAAEAIEADGQYPLEFVVRHVTGDWGELDDEDKETNETALQYGYRLLSAYRTKESQTKIWIITESDRSVTTILLPEEY